MIVMDDTDCMVNIAKFYLEFTQDESGDGGVSLCHCDEIRIEPQLLE